MKQIYVGTMNMDTRVKIKDLCKVYISNTGANVLALKTISVEFSSTGMVFLIGKNGSGKSTLLNLIGALDKPTSGNVMINDIDISRQNRQNREQYRRDMVAYVLSNHALLYELNVRGNLELPLVVEGVSNKLERQKRVQEIINQFDLSEFSDRNINELSSGQLQRIAVARALIKDSSILLCDEPSENLDEESTIKIFSTLKELSKDKLIIVVTHEKELAENYGDRIIELDQGKIIRDDVRLNKNTPILEKDNIELKTRFSIFRILKYFKLFMKKQLIMMMIIVGLFSLVLTFFGNFYALSKYDSSDALVATLQMNDDYVIPVTEYVHTARFLGDEMLYFGVFPFQEGLPSEIRDRLSHAVNDRATILSSYYLKKNFQDFIDYHVSIGPPYSFSPYISTIFTDVIIVDDFSQLHLNLLYGTMPSEVNEVLIYDYMAFNLLQTEALDFVEMENLVDYTLIDRDTQMEMRISGIIGTNYESYSYTESGNYNDYPFETFHLARYQSIYASPEFLLQLEAENMYFSFNEIIFSSNLSETMSEENNFRKFRMVDSLSMYNFIGASLDHNSGILLSKHQFASLIGVDPLEVDADLVNSYVIDGMFRYLLIDESIRKASRSSVQVSVIGVYESDGLDPFVIDCLYGENMDHITLNAMFRMNYLMLGTNWYVNSKLLEELEWPYLPRSFFLENPDYEVYGFAENTPYTVLIDKANGYVSSIKNYGLNYAYLSFGLLAVLLTVYVFSYHKKHSYKIAVISMQGGNYGHVTIMITAQLIILTTLAFLISIFPILRRIELLNRDLAKNLPYEIFFFSMNVVDFLLIFGISILVVSIGMLFMFIYFRSKQPIEMMKEIM